jgi:hypothetical protein
VNLQALHVEPVDLFVAALIHSQTASLYRASYNERVPIVSITRLRVRSWRYLLPFIVYAFRTSRQAKSAPGNIAVSLLRDTHNTFWTRTVWTTGAALKAFMLSGPHRQVMPRLLEWCDEASVVRWEQETDLEPGWHEAHQRLQADGRRSKVNHPSSAQNNYQIRPPKVARLTSEAQA